jgi:nitroimidazol reductase NimA-like FMN-containing flavoprotein (pyridoxamine 5'-phosphate oxidase superfamily)
MMSLNLTKEEREDFLAQVHIGVISFNEPNRGPLSAPIWYDYKPGGDPWVLIGTDSRKAKLIKAGDRFSLVAQQEQLPYKYVSVEGIAEVRSAKDGEILGMAVRYLGEEQGQAYASQSGGENLIVSMKIERWLTLDYGKIGS